MARTVIVALVAGLLALQAPGVGAQRGRAATVLEYRLEAVSGAGRSTETFRWRDGSKSVELEPEPFMTVADVQSATAIPQKMAPGRFSIQLVHTPAGARRFRAVANRDRERQFSIVFDGAIVQSYAFPPPPKDVDDRASQIYGPFSRDEATAIVRAIERAIHARPPR